MATLRGKNISGPTQQVDRDRIRADIQNIESAILKDQPVIFQFPVQYRRDYPDVFAFLVPLKDISCYNQFQDFIIGVIGIDFGRF